MTRKLHVFHFFGSALDQTQIRQKIAQDDTRRQMRNDKIRCQPLKNMMPRPNDKPEWQANDKQMIN